MPRKFHKQKLLLDEGLYPRSILHRTNNRHSVIHIKHDLHKGGISDKEIYEIAKKENRIIVTYNIDDFRGFAKYSNLVGVIGVTQGLTPDQLDIKLNSLLNRSLKKTLYGKYTPLSRNK